MIKMKKQMNVREGTTYFAKPHSVILSWADNRRDFEAGRVSALRFSLHLSEKSHFLPSVFEFPALLIMNLFRVDTITVL